MSPIITAAAAAPTGFLGVDWGAIALVSVVTLVAAVVIVTLYSLGMRLLSIGSPNDGVGPAATTNAKGRPLAASIGGYACVAVGILAVVYGIYLVIPIFHS